MKIYRNAIIMAAGTSSRFVPLSAECPKGLIEVKGEVLIERQIRQLHEAGITDITIVVGYKAEMFEYLKGKFGVDIVLNEDYAHFNNTSSIIRVVDKLNNTYICSSDNYFPLNVFEYVPKESYYSALYANGVTTEYCITTDDDDQIVDVTVGGNDKWYMVGHVYFNNEFSSAFRKVILEEYANHETKLCYWEDIYIKYLDTLPKMKIKRYDDNAIKEFDSIDELRKFDESYIMDTRSSIVKEICKQLGEEESNVYGFKNIKHNGNYLLFSFNVGGGDTYIYSAENGAKIEKQ